MYYVKLIKISTANNDGSDSDVSITLLMIWRCQSYFAKLLYLEERHELTIAFSFTLRIINMSRVIGR